MVKLDVTHNSFKLHLLHLQTCDLKINPSDETIDFCDLKSDNPRGNAVRFEFDFQIFSKIFNHISRHQNQSE